MPFFYNNCSGVRRLVFYQMQKSMPVHFTATAATHGISVRVAGWPVFPPAIIPSGAARYVQNCWLFCCSLNVLN